MNKERSLSVEIFGSNCSDCSIVVYGKYDAEVTGDEMDGAALCEKFFWGFKTEKANAFLDDNGNLVLAMESLCYKFAVELDRIEPVRKLIGRGMLQLEPAGDCNHFGFCLSYAF